MKAAADLELLGLRTIFAAVPQSGDEFSYAAADARDLSEVARHLLGEDVLQLNSRDAIRQRLRDAAMWLSELADEPDLEGKDRDEVRGVRGLLCRHRGLLALDDRRQWSRRCAMKRARQTKVGCRCGAVRARQAPSQAAPVTESRDEGPAACRWQ